MRAIISGAHMRARLQSVINDVDPSEIKEHNDVCIPHNYVCNMEITCMSCDR